MKEDHEILINAIHINSNGSNTPYEFILNYSLVVTNCIRISENQEKVKLIDAPNKNLAGMLFELNHVRVNPNIDNELIIRRLTNAVEKTGVSVTNKPDKDSIGVCFKPIGQINANVRFHLDNNGRPIFLSPSTKPPLKVLHNDKLIKV